ncbi:MAG: class I SAM-dependent rRNA methyltransferase [Candidatus Eisenbacteria sp.]|nr:class I SAM-dependent rRNA methyltransferase [Candidatus Eisenbacteria bacterium]
MSEDNCSERPRRAGPEHNIGEHPIGEHPIGEHPGLPYRVVLKKGREKSVLRRHPWLFSGAIEQLEGTEEAQPGDLGEIRSASGEHLGIGVVNPGSQLAIRMLRFDTGAVDLPWVLSRLHQAAALRARMVPKGTTAMRLVNAEGDGLPGLIVDRYADYLVVQCASLGMSRLQNLWLPALGEVFEPKGIVDRSQRARGDANLSRQDTLLTGEAPPQLLEVQECDRRFAVDIMGGQKTGHYLDQRENRRRVAALARGGKVLDAFAYTGAFGVWAGTEGAEQVVAVETSAAALKLARESWRLNGLDEQRLRTVRAGVQEFLRHEQEQFDVIILDPPAFAKEKVHVQQATRGYKDINFWALKRLAPGGYLATFSCSQHIGTDLFQKIIFGASIDARVPLQWLSRLGAGGDHPVHLDHPQGEYLKGLLLRSLS